MITINRRMTATLPGGVVVFLIGARINRWWRPDRWLPALRAMPRMLAELEKDRTLGLLGYESFFGRTTLIVQYWKSLDHLLAYAKARDSEHLPAWREFNRRIGTNGDLGIWHETYAVAPRAFENIYVNMPPFGLGKIGRLEAVGAGTEGAKRRLAGGVVPDAIESPVNRLETSL